MALVKNSNLNLKLDLSKVEIPSDPSDSGSYQEMKDGIPVFGNDVLNLDHLAEPVK
jgi:hypothetical protein